jgi:hypothetical protein
MTRFKLFLPLLLALPFIFILLVIQLNTPTAAKAKPLAGFTPTPVSTPDDGDDDGSGNDDGGDDNPSQTHDPPTDYILVEVERCDLLHCSVSVGDAGNQANFQSLALAGSAAVPQPEILLPVRLVHDGSGFIVEGELSDVKATRFAVPYPGRWEVWLTGNPRFMTPEVMELSRSNLADLQVRLAQAPVSLGQVEADTPGPQLIKCPLACVIPEPPPVEAPPHVPETGAATNNYLSLIDLLIAGLDLTLIGLIMWAALHYKRGKPYV